MNTHDNNKQENKSKLVANAFTQSQNISESTFQFEDNRPEMIQRRKLQELANNSPQVKKATQFQAMADNHPAKHQQPIQKRANNTGLPDNLKTGIENLSGYSMEDVKVHYNSNKPAQLQAHAYAQGTDIHLGPGQERHLAHEAWHVAQQKQGKVKPTVQMRNGFKVNDDDGLEKEADLMGFKAFNFDEKKLGAIAQRMPQKIMDIDKTQLITPSGTQKQIESPSFDTINSDVTNKSTKAQNYDNSIIQRVKAGNYTTNDEGEIYMKKNGSLTDFVTVSFIAGQKVTVNEGAEEKTFAPEVFSRKKARTWCNTSKGNGWIRDELLNESPKLANSQQAETAPKTLPEAEGMRAEEDSDNEKKKEYEEVTAEEWNEKPPMGDNKRIVTVPNSAACVTLYKDNPGLAVPLKTPVLVTGLLYCMGIRVAIRKGNETIAAFIAHSEGGKTSSTTGEVDFGSIVQEFDDFLNSVCPRSNDTSRPSAAAASSDESLTTPMKVETESKERRSD